jgi:hypothetical protein
MAYKTIPQEPKISKGGEEDFFSPFPHLILLFIGPKHVKK